MQNMFKSKIFWGVTIIIASAVLIVFLSTGRAYRSEMDILFIPKNEKTVKNIDQILANVEKLPLSLTFYDKLIELNPNIEDMFFGETNDRRKKYWNEKISLQRLGESGIIRVNVFSENQSQVEALGQRVAADIITVMDRYYDAENNLDMRVIDGPINSVFNKNKASAWIIWGVVLSMLAGMVVYLFIDLAKMLFSSKITLSKPVIFGQEKFVSVLEKIPEQKETFSNKPAEIFSFPIKEEPYLVTGKKSNAPENLPVVDETMLFTDEKINGFSKEKAAAKEEPKTHEASAEEIRARLNKLLSGGM